MFIFVVNGFGFCGFLVFNICCWYVVVWFDNVLGFISYIFLIVFLERKNILLYVYIYNIFNFKIFIYLEYNYLNLCKKFNVFR